MEVFFDDPTYPETVQEWWDWNQEIAWALAREDGFVSPVWGEGDFVSPRMADSIPAYKLEIAERIQESES